MNDQITHELWFCAFALTLCIGLCTMGRFVSDDEHSNRVMVEESVLKGGYTGFMMIAAVLGTRYFRGGVEKLKRVVEVDPEQQTSLWQEVCAIFGVLGHSVVMSFGMASLLLPMFKHSSKDGGFWGAIVDHPEKYCDRVVKNAGAAALSASIAGFVSFAAMVMGFMVYKACRPVSSSFEHLRLLHSEPDAVVRLGDAFSEVEGRGARF